MAYRVVADHARTLTIAITDGGNPSNEGRGYVLRRILRRGVRYARRKFEVEIGNFFPELVDTVIETLGDAFPELHGRVDVVKEILEEEEKSFAKTLDRGEKLFNSMIKKLGSAENIIPGRDAFRLYDTYGFPIDLTRIMAAERGYLVDEDGFIKEQEKAKEISRAKKSKKGQEKPTLDVHMLADLENKHKIPTTDDSFKYGKGDICSKVLAIVNSAKKFLQASKNNQNETLGVLLDRTNFYAEAGGQEADTGNLIKDSDDSDDAMEFKVEDVQAFGGYVLHIGSLKHGILSVGDAVSASYDESRRYPLRNNHSATHLLNYALKEVIGDEVDQKGSLVAQDKLRFDFSSRSAMSLDQLDETEVIVDKFIKNNFKIYSEEVPLPIAKSINGLRAVFGEVYPDPVRVVSVKYPIKDLLADPTSEKWLDSSIEFCGGTHVEKCGDIRQFAILEESSIAKGIRRIIAVTGEEAHEAARLAADFEKELENIKKLNGFSLENELKKAKIKVEKLSISTVRKQRSKNSIAKLSKELIEKQKAAQAEQLKEAVEKINSIIESEKEKKFLVYKFENAENKLLSNVINYMKTNSDRAVLLINVDDEKQRVMHQCFVPKTLVTKGLSADDWATSVADTVGGKKGGKAETAQGSGPNVEAAEEAVNMAEMFAKMKLQ